MQYLIALLVGIIALMYYQNTQLDKEIVKANSKAYIQQKSINECKDTIDTQNDSIEALAIDYEHNFNKLQELQNKPDKIRYKVIYKEIPTIEVKSNECEDIKTLLDDIRSTGF